MFRDFPDGPGVRALSFCGRGRGYNPWSGREVRSSMLRGAAKKLKEQTNEKRLLKKGRRDHGREGRAETVQWK